MNHAVEEWLLAQKQKYESEVEKCKQWVAEAEEEVKKAHDQHSGFKYRLQQAQLVLSEINERLKNAEA